ncbi:hypothetical protein ACWEWI_39845 [Streptomyces sp. NPDC003753]|uniref:hypothetical protein n=1 Tax=Streptomyces sp. Y2F8-2 TaxID=2759675 RepID=UPI0019086CFD|nr:hypothetical protein [Streptomyces sp. Y2F8-2]
MGIRPSGIEVRGVRGVDEDGVGLGAEAGPVPVDDGVLGVAEERFLAGSGAEAVLVGLVAEEVVPGVLAVERGVGPLSTVDAGVGGVGMAEVPSGRPPVPPGEWSVVVGAGAAWD